jgi:hypothetical protein
MRINSVNLAVDSSRGEPGAIAAPSGEPGCTAGQGTGAGGRSEGLQQGAGRSVWLHAYGVKSFNGACRAGLPHVAALACSKRHACGMKPHGTTAER